MSFRIGRRYASHTYPEPRRNTTVPLARNFASGPESGETLAAEATLVPWAVIDSVQAWSPTTTYAIDDIVSGAGTTWISLQANNLNNAPVEGAFWTQNTVVPITPSSSGVVVIHANIAFESAAVAVQELIVNVLVDGVALTAPSSLEVSFGVGDSGTISVLAEATGLPLGVRADIAIQLTPDAADVFALQQANTTIEVREMQASTG